MNLSKSVRLLIFVTIISYLVYNLWEISKTVEGIFFNQSAAIGNVNPIIILIIFSPLVGLIFRFVGSCFALYAVYLVWIKQTKGFLEIKSKISKTVLMEAIYFISIVPNFIFIIQIGTPVILVSYIIQTFLTIPFLLVLRRKINNNNEKILGTNLKTWIGLAFVAYLAAIWINHISRWFDMSLIGGIPMLLTGLNPLGFFNSVIILSLSVIFAVISFLNIKKNGIISKWFGLSTTMLGLHFIVLVIFYALQNSLNVLYLFEMWTIPLFGLGLSIILTKK